MKAKLFYFILSLSAISCQAQPKLEAIEIYDSRIESYISKNKEIDPVFFSSKRFWLQYESYSVLGNEESGIKYIYNFENRSLMSIEGLFKEPRAMLLNHDYTGGIGHNFYFDNSIICWLAKSGNQGTVVLRVVDIKKNSNQEIVFNVPKQFLSIDPIIIDTNKLLYNKYVLNSNSKVDTLQIDNNTTFPHDGDKIFMRKNGFMIDKYFDQEDPKFTLTKTNPIDYNYIDNNRLVTQKVILTNVISGKYKIETNSGSVWLLSHKVNPNKFLLYESETDKTYPFTLDDSIFNLDNLSIIEPVISTETAPGLDIKFSYLTSMTEHNIYIYIIKNGIKLYKVSDYRKLLQ